MGFVCNGLNYLNHDKISQNNHDLRDTSGSARGYFSIFVVMTGFQINKFVKTNSKLGIQFLILMNDFMYKYVISLMEKGERRESNVML